MREIHNCEIKPEKSKVDILKSYLTIVLAIEMLEYEDKNYLRYSNKQNSEEKIVLLKSALAELETEA